MLIDVNDTAVGRMLTVELTDAEKTRLIETGQVDGWTYGSGRPFNVTVKVPGGVPAKG